MGQYFCKIDGIKGESAEKPDYFEVKTISYGVTAKASGSTGGTGGHTTGRADHSRVILTKQIDKASPLLLLTCCKGQSPKQALIEGYRNMGEGKQSKFFEYKLSKAAIVRVEQNASEGNSPDETVELSFSEIEWLYIEYDNDSNKKKGEVKGGWNCDKNEEKK